MPKAKYTRRRVILLDEPLDERLQKRADESGASVCVFVRQLIIRELGPVPDESD